MTGLETSTRWHEYFMRIASETAALSKDPSTKVGAVAVIDRRIVAVGFNGFPMGVRDDPQRYGDRERKLLMTVHAESNCVADAARRGVSLNGCTLYVTHPPCPHCCGLLIQAGVDKVFHPAADKDFLSRWAEQVKITREMCIESGTLMMEIADGA